MNERSLSERRLREEEEEDNEFEIQELRDEIRSARHNRYMSGLSQDLQLGSSINRRRSHGNDSFFTRLFDFSQDCSVHPNNK